MPAKETESGVWKIVIAIFGASGFVAIVSFIIAPLFISFF